MFSAISSTLLWTGLSLRGIAFIICSGDFLYNSVKNLSYCRQNKILPNIMRHSRFSNEQRYIVWSTQTFSGLLWSARKHIFNSFSFLKRFSKALNIWYIIICIIRVYFCQMFQRSFEGFMASFGNTFSHSRHIGSCWFCGVDTNPYFRYSTLYCLHLFPFFYFCVTTPF